MLYRMAKLLSRSEFAALCGVNPSSITKACSSALLPACAGKRIDADHPAALAYLAERQEATAPQPLVGVDPFYERAVEHCRSSGRWTVNSIKTGLAIGTERATRIFELIRAAGLVLAPGDHVTVAELPTISTPELVSTARAAYQRGHAAAREKLKASPVLPPDSQPDAPEVPEHIEAFADMTLRELIHRFGTDVRFLDWLKATKEIEMIAERRIKNAAASGKLITRDLVSRGVIDPFNSAHLRLMTDGAKSIAVAVVAKHQAGTEPIEIERYVSDVIGSFLKPIKNKVAQALRQSSEATDLWEAQ